MNSSDRDVSLLEFSIHPPKGWVRYRRDKLAISGPQLAAKMGVTKQRISALEKSELSGAASLKTMRQAAEALGCEFVYALVPKGSQDEHVTLSGSQQLDPLECIHSVQYMDQITDLCRSFHISSLALYGSAARGELNEFSDINFLAEFASVKPLISEFEQMEIQFGRLFGRRVSIADQGVLDDPLYVDGIVADLKIIYLS